MVLRHVKGQGQGQELTLLLAKMALLFKSNYYLLLFVTASDTVPDQRG